MRLNLTRKDLIEGGTAGLVFLSGAMTGHYAAIGMTPVQWMGAAAAILGSITAAVAVRIWPAETIRARD